MLEIEKWDKIDDICALGTFSLKYTGEPLQLGSSSMLTSSLVD